MDNAAKDVGNKGVTQQGEEVTISFDPQGGTFENNSTTEIRER